MKRKGKKTRSGRTSRRMLARKDMSIGGEVAHIIRRAQAHDSRIVTLGPLLFFSTQTGDAWVLDPEEHLALCLARDGEPLPVQITETEETFGIGWGSEYRIEGDLFIHVTADRRESVIQGYPVAEIERRWQRVSPLF